MTSQEKYIQKLDDMFASAVSVVFTPSREPRRTVEAVKAMGARDNVPVFVWNDVYGWKVFTGQDRTVGVPVDADSPVGNFYQALRRILGFKIGENTSNASSRFDYEKGAAYIVMEGTSPHLGLLPMTTTLLKDYAYSFPETLMSLVLITSESYTIPEELAHDILVVDFDLPTKTDLRHAWESTVANQYESKNLPIPETYIPGDSVDALVNAASGMTILEAETAYSRAFTLNDRLFPDIPVENLLAQVHRSKEDIVKKSQTLEMVNPIPVDSIGGLELLKDWFITRSVCFSEEARKAKVDAPKGVALIGPPGTGKSVCSKAVASILNLPLVRVDLGRLFGSLVGQTEARTRTMLKELEAMAPCIVWVDEVDKAGLSSGANGDSGVSSRLLGSLLTHMSENESGLFWIFTANRTENLPSEFLRKGRLDEVFSVLPPTWAERRQIFDIHLSKRGINIDDIADFDQVLTESRGFVSAEIEAACKEAKVLSFYRNVPVTSSLLRSTLKGIIPISEAYKDQFDAMTEWAQNNARPSSEQEVDVDASSPLPSSIPESLRARRRRH
jgi:AAA ATPase central domain protein